MFDSLRSALATLLEIVETRLELITTEVEEERLRLVDLMLTVCVTLFFVGLGVLLSVAFVVALLWDSYRLLTLGLLSVACLAIGMAGLWTWRSKATRKLRFLAATLSELRRDVETLRPHNGQ